MFVIFRIPDCFKTSISITGASGIPRTRNTLLGRNGWRKLSSRGVNLYSDIGFNSHMFAFKFSFVPTTTHEYCGCPNLATFVSTLTFLTVVPPKPWRVSRQNEPGKSTEPKPKPPAFAGSNPTPPNPPKPTPPEGAASKPKPLVTGTELLAFVFRAVHTARSHSNCWRCTKGCTLQNSTKN